MYVIIYFMKRSRRRRKNTFFVGFGCFAIVFAIVLISIQFFTKTGLFFVPGVVSFNDSLTEDEKTRLSEIFNDDLTLSADLSISAETSEQLGELAENQILSGIMVPVTDFYDARVDISEFSEDEYKFIPLSELDYKSKLLSIDSKYYLNTFNSGARFRIITFDSDKYTEEVSPLIQDLRMEQFTSENVLSFAQTGVTALSREMNAKLNSVGDANYFADNIKNYLSSFDITHTSNESSFTDAANSDNICSDPRFINTLTAIGLDIIELTGNHNLDCGATAAIETIDIYSQNNIKTVGGGKTASDAAIPLNIDEKGTKITFLAYNESTGGATTTEAPGANQYNEENAASEIAKAKEQGDFVIVDIQYFECSAYASEYEDPTCDSADSAAGDQVGFFRHLIDLGADVVVGTSAHQPQTFEIYNDGEIYYGLGNLFFDQYWWPGTTRSLVLEHYFYQGKLLQTRIMPTVYGSNMQPKLMDREKSEWFIDRLIKVRP